MQVCRVVMTAYARNGVPCRVHRRLPQFHAGLTYYIIIGLIRAAHPPRGTRRPVVAVRPTLV